MPLQNGCKINLANNEINGGHSYFLEYYNLIKQGDIIAGHELISELENLLDDLEDADYEYDTKSAHFRIDFIETFCKHTKSPFYGKPFILELWEKAVIEVFYSFKWSHSQLRRFKKCLLLIARKNGKSTLCAALALAELMVNLGGVDIICSSNDDAQATIIFDEINNMREQFDPKDKRTHKNLKGIFNLLNKSTIKKLSDRTKNKEGRNIDYAYIDEIHEMVDNVIYKSIQQSTSTKEEPGIFLITTEGFVDDGFLDDELKKARKIIDGTFDDPTYLPWLYTQDSEEEIWQDESSWSKANPSLGVVKKVDYIYGQIRDAQVSQADRAFMLSKDFNFKQNSANTWLMESELTNEATFPEEKLRGLFAIGGVDLAETTDLACARAMVAFPSGQKFVLQKYFIPEAKIEEGTIDDKKDYLEWARQGLIEVTPGSENDFSLITAWYVKLYKQLGLRMFKVGYDNALAKYWVTEMEDLGFEMEKVKQDKFNMSPGMKSLEADLKGNKLNYNNNPIDRWCLRNTGYKIDGMGLMMPIKAGNKQHLRIDGAVAQIIAHSTYIRYRAEYLSLMPQEVS